ncbi:MAG: SagB family peptide dehydrogenase [Planctomycetia bacterium]|nr:SagB family peptide dehydrogenase [Planctomycetia bacterium]
MAVSVKLSWHDRVVLSAGEGQAVVAGPEARLALRSVAPEIVSALRRLAPPGETEEKLAESILADGNVHSLARWYFHVDQLGRRGLICRALHGDAGPLATLVPLCQAARSSSAPGAPAIRALRTGRNGHSRRPRSGPDISYRLSRFAYLRRTGDEMVLESPRSGSRLVLHDPSALAVVGLLAAGCTVAELCEKIPSLESVAVGSLLALMQDASMVAESEGSPSEDATDPGFESWEFHDLLFHSRSRRGRSDAQFGATYRLADRPPPPALKPLAGNPIVDLYRPDQECLEREDPPFARVQNRRRSLRKFGTDPITAQQFGEFLHRVGRVTETWTAEIPGSSPPSAMEFAGRPYPAGGALYELEFYPVVRACRGFAPGLYEYDPAGHRLHLVSGCNSDVNALLDEAASSAGIEPRTIQVLIILASRFQRIAWKYESIAYALTLKHVGVVYQTMYLAATAMGLAPCAVGCGDSDLFARAAGTDYHVESSVGEFLLGSRE